MNAHPHAAQPPSHTAFHTLAQALDNAATSQARIRFYDNTGHVLTTCSYTQLHHTALQLAGILQAHKLPRHARVALLADTCIEFIALFFACQYAGLLPCPLPYAISATDQDAYTRKLTHLLKTAQASFVITPKSIDPIIQNIAQTLHLRAATYEALHETLATQTVQMPGTQQPWPLHPLQESEPAYLQFSSGSTSEPKGILVSQQAAIANLKSILYDGLKVTPEDKAFSWLPFYHDMGLVGFVLAPVCGQVSIDYISPRSFARRPSLWLTLMSSLRSTITYAPDFAYALAAKRLPAATMLDLSALRIAGVGGDMVHAQTLKTFAQQMATHGFRFTAFSPSYGLAEATLAITMTPPEEPPFIRQFDQAGIHHELVSSGKPLPGYDICITPLPPTAHTAPSMAGEIWVKGPSIAQTIEPAQPSGPQTPAQKYLPTGDLGFLYDNHLFITGRSKDLIIIRGRNIWAQDIEWSVCEQEPAIQKQHVCAVGIPQTTPAGTEEQLTVLIDHQIPDKNTRKLTEQRLINMLSQNFAIVAHIVWLKPHQLTLTSSGKLARAQIKNQYLAGQLAVL